MNEPFVEMKGISKYFTDVKANDQIDLEINHGEILALLGENGAGKTTLMNILYGLYEQDEGEIFIKDKKVNISSPKDAIKNQIGMVHQHFMLVPTHSVVENIVLGMDSKKGILNLKKAAREIKELSKQLGFDIDPFNKVKDLPVGAQQRVEILKSIYRGASLLIMDEPTAVLTPQEVDELFELLNKFVSDNNSVVLITHKLNEIMDISDRVTVLRDGKLIGTVKRENTSEQELAQMMVGRDVSFEIDKDRKEPEDKKIVKVNNLSLSKRDNQVLKDLSFEIKKGEIFGIAGVSGNGQEELANALAGLEEIDQGQILLENNDITNLDTKERIENRLGFIPADRQNTGLILDMSVRENTMIKDFYQPPYCSKGVINKEKTFKKTRKLIEDYNIKAPNTETETKDLSGGHQQKVVVARELSLDPKFLIAFQPTRGLDVGAIEYVHDTLIEARNQGKSILLISTELSEIFKLSDRIGVLYQGEILKTFPIEEATIEEVGLLMAGITDESKEDQ